MVKMILTTLTLIILLAPPITWGEPHDQAGTAGLAFLKLGIGARAVGMGEAFVASADDATALFWNPAGLCQISGVHLGLMHAEWFQDVRLEYMGAVLGRAEDAFGLSFTFNTAGQIERRDQPTALPLGTFSAHDLALSGSYARRAGQSLSLGATLKILYEKIHLDDGWGWAGDAGFLYHTPLQGVMAGGSISNLGPQMKLRQEKFKLPTSYRLGLSYRPAFLRFPETGVILAADLVKPVDNRLRFHWGGELGWRRLAALRAGYDLGYDEKSFSAGVGVSQGRWRIDYAFVPYSSALGDTHRISLGIEL
jgi:hypothetical protein